MTVSIPAGVPQTLGEAFAHIGSITAPSLDDLKMMVLLEAAGQEMYRVTAEGSQHAAVTVLLERFSISLDHSRTM